MAPPEISKRLAETSERAKRAEDRGDGRLASSEWRRYRLIADSARDPDDLLAEGVALSTFATEFAR